MYDTILGYSANYDVMEPIDEEAWKVHVLTNEWTPPPNVDWPYSTKKGKDKVKELKRLVAHIKILQ